jgi:hypothetical protein
MNSSSQVTLKSEALSSSHAAAESASEVTIVEFRLRRPYNRVWQS